MAKMRVKDDCRAANKVAGRIAGTFARITFASSQVQRGVAVGVLHIDVSIGCQESLDHGLKAAARRIVQRCSAVLSLHAYTRPSA